jgi:hypothetical protein
MVAAPRSPQRFNVQRSNVRTFPPTRIPRLRRRCVPPSLGMTSLTAVEKPPAGLFPGISVARVRRRAAGWLFERLVAEALLENHGRSVSPEFVTSPFSKTEETWIEARFVTSDARRRERWSLRRARERGVLVVRRSERAQAGTARRVVSRRAVEPSQNPGLKKKPGRATRRDQGKLYWSWEAGASSDASKKRRRRTSRLRVMRGPVCWRNATHPIVSHRANQPPCAAR